MNMAIIINIFQFLLFFLTFFVECGWFRSDVEILLKSFQMVENVRMRSVIDHADPDMHGTLFGAAPLS